MFRYKTIALIAGLVICAAAQVMAATDILPCAVGNKWEYDSVKLVRATISLQGKAMAGFTNASSGGSVYEVVSIDDKSKPAVFVYTETTNMQSVGGGKPEVDKSEMKVTSDQQAMRILATTTENSGEDKAEKHSYNPPLIYYRKDASSGKPWDVGAMVDGDTKTFVTGRGTTRETVTVPAGTFKDCLKVIYSSDDVSGSIELWNKTFNIKGGKTRGIYWIADGIGVVKELEVSTSTAESTAEGKTVALEAASCTVSELKPGYVVK